MPVRDHYACTRGLVSIVLESTPYGTGLQEVDYLLAQAN